MGAESAPRNWRTRKIRLQGPVGGNFSREKQEEGASLARQVAEADGSLWASYKPEAGKAGYEIRSNRDTHQQEMFIEGKWIVVSDYMKWKSYITLGQHNGELKFDTYEEWLAKTRPQAGGNGNGHNGNGHGETTIYQATDQLVQV